MPLRDDFPMPLWQKSTPVIRTLTERIRDSSLTGSAGIWATAIKTLDEVRSATTVLADDTTLQFAMLGGHKYSVRIRVWFDTTAAGDFKWALTGPALNSARVTRKWIIPGGSAYAGVLVDTTYTASQSVVSAGTTGGYVEVDATIRPSADGIFRFQWAQDTSDAGNTSVLAGSYMDYVTN